MEEFLNIKFKFVLIICLLILFCQTSLKDVENQKKKSVPQPHIDEQVDQAKEKLEENDLHRPEGPCPDP